jgi:SAM-dependent methyltransferase
MQFSSPGADLLHTQAAWLAPARARLLRRVQIAGRRRVLDLGCGAGAVTRELVRRVPGPVVALDWNLKMLTRQPASLAGAARVCGDAMQLPFGSETFDLVFSQFTLLWLDPQAAVAEVCRVLRPDGVLVAIEPDFGGLIEFPPAIATRKLWCDALLRAGGEPEIGRRLPGLLAAAGFKVQVDLLDQLEPPSPQRFDFLRGLPLDQEEQAMLARIQTADRAVSEEVRVVHLPVFLVTATK